jgi:hypothetical protein
VVVALMSVLDMEPFVGYLKWERVDTAGDMFLVGVGSLDFPAHDGANTRQ